MTDNSVNDHVEVPDDDATILARQCRSLHDSIKEEATGLMQHWIGTDQRATLYQIMNQIHLETIRDGCAFFLALSSCLEDKTLLLAVTNALNSIVASKVKSDYLIAKEPKAPRSGVDPPEYEDDDKIGDKL